MLTGFSLSIKPLLEHYHTELLCYLEEHYQTRSAYWLLLHVPQALSELGKTALSFSAPDAWNELQRFLKIN